MRKLIMFIFMVLSLAAIVGITMSLSSLLSLLDLGTIDLNDISTLLQNSTITEIMQVLGYLIWGLFQLYGIPIIVFLISLNGLAIKR